MTGIFIFSERDFRAARGALGMNRHSSGGARRKTPGGDPPGVEKGGVGL